MMQGLNCRLDDLQVATVCKPVLTALTYIHSRGIIHRDVKGDSILLSSKWEIKLADFGYSAQVSRSVVSALIIPRGLCLSY